MIESFEQLAIGDDIKHALADMEFTAPTPIQAEVIPYILEGKDCLAQAPTGTGKTCAFGIPLIERIDREDGSVQALILCPTRELAMQITDELHNLTKYAEGVRVLTVYGGQPIQRQLSGLKKRPQIIVGTPGRVIDHLDRHSIRLQSLRMLVLDEADEMLDMGFQEDIDRILETAPKERQTTLFSATMSPDILRVSKSYQVDPVEVKTKLSERDIPMIAQFCVKIREKDKIKTLMKIIDDNEIKLALVFCNTKIRAQQLADTLTDYGYNSESLHGDLKQKERDGVMKGYRSGCIDILVATDVAARGIDVSGIEAVFNFDVPNDPEYYVHRIGRTARANREGAAYTLATPKQLGDVEQFERFTKTKIERISVALDKDTSVDNKKASLALAKIGGNNEAYKAYLYKRLAELNEGGEHEYGFEDAAAALLAKFLEHDVKEPDEAFPEDNSSKRVKKNSDSVRFFMNLGTRDGGQFEIEQFIISTSGIEPDELFEVRMLENYGFCEGDKSATDKLASIDGKMFGGRRIAFEVAGGKRERPDYKPSGFRPKPAFKSSGFRSEGKSFGRDDRPRFERGNREDRPRFESGTREDRPRFEGGTREDRPAREFTGERKPFRKREEFSSDRPAVTADKREKSPSQKRHADKKDKYADKKRKPDSEKSE